MPHEMACQSFHQLANEGLGEYSRAKALQHFAKLPIQNFQIRVVKNDPKVPHKFFDTPLTAAFTIGIMFDGIVKSSRREKMLQVFLRECVLTTKQARPDLPFYAFRLTTPNHNGLGGREGNSNSAIRVYEYSTCSPWQLKRNNADVDVVVVE